VATEAIAEPRTPKLTLNPHPSQPGHVYLVGAGPGDPGLITWRGVQCLRRADAVLFDYLANPSLLAHAPAAAERICLGRHGRERIWSQDEINERLVRLAREGKCVVRLKAGDPAVFSRLSEEVAALEAAGIAYEIVPGITAALAAGSYAGIPLTERGRASAVAFVTGHEQGDKDIPQIDFSALAAFPGTLVVYMGVTTAGEWTRALIDAGKPAETPAAIVRRCTWPDQQTIRCTLGTIAERITQAHVRPPVISIIGEVAAAAQLKSWFIERPLFGQRVLITRPRHQAGRMWDLLSELGAQCLLQPAIEIETLADWSAVDAAIERLADFDWLVFSSANGVEHLLGRLLNTGRDVRALGPVKIAAIGPATAEALRQFHVQADLTPDEYRAEALAEALVEAAAQHTTKPRFLLVRASRGREVLAETLTAAGCSVKQIVTYSSVDVATPDPEIAALLRQGRIDWITVTSSAIARSLVRLFGEDLRRAKLASISPITTDTLRELGYEPAAEAREYTMEGVVEAIRVALLAASSGTR
jgi:uroporphyrinogen III methyltransferase/synthase